MDVKYLKNLCNRRNFIKICTTEQQYFKTTLTILHTQFTQPFFREEYQTLPNNVTKNKSEIFKNATPN